MARLPLFGGSYSARSIIANCQRCLNLYPEKNAVGAPVSLTHYQRPGLIPLLAAAPVQAPVRCLYRASNGIGYAVIGNGVYLLTPGSPYWTTRLLGNITPDLKNPVSMADNGFDIVIVEGTTKGWTIRMDTNVFAPITSTSFHGGDKVDYIDTFMIFNRRQKNIFDSTLSSTQKTPSDPTSVVFDPHDLYFGIKSGYPDDIQWLVVNRREIILVGSLKSEVWYNAGLAAFPFAVLPGAFFEHGTMSRYTVAAMDISVFMLGQDLQGMGIVYKIKGYNCNRISNYAMEYQIREIARKSTIADAIGYCYQQDGHSFYVLHFPSGDKTWVFDDSLSDDPTIAWHEEAWTDLNGVHHRHRGNCHAFVRSTHLIGDWENGMIYEQDFKTYTDTVAGTEYRITRTRTFPHIGTGEVEVGPMGRKPVLADGQRVQFHKFEADIESGTSPLPEQITLRYSDDRGRTWSSDVLQHGGNLGEYLTWPTWQGLGIARDRVFELEYSHNGEAALNGAWVEATVLEG